jgi:Rod binding domain-containing protein
MSDIGNTTTASLLQTANGQLGMDRLANATNQLKSVKANKAEAAAQDFEAVFLSEMLKPMFETIEVDETFGGGKGEEVFRGLLIQEMGKSIAKQGGMGLADQVRAELIKIQERA